MRVSDTEAAQRVADNDNLVGELVEALRDAVSAAEKATSGVVRIDWLKNARAVLAKAQGAQQ